MATKEEVLKLRNKKWSWLAIGVYFGISRSRAHQIGSGYKVPTTETWIKLIKVLDYACQICGRNKNLVIHHIDGNDRNNNIKNLTIFCRSCHMSYHLTKPYKFKVCKNCKKEFAINVPKRYCSTKCKNDFYRMVIKCEVCGNEFKEMKSSMKLRPRRFCSKRCQGKWLGSNYNPLKMLDN